MPFLKTKFYPVDPKNLVILNTPKNREVDCAYPNGSTTFSGYIGIKGERLNAIKAYEDFTIKEA